MLPADRVFCGKCGHAQSMHYGETCGESVITVGITYRCCCDGFQDTDYCIDGALMAEDTDIPRYWTEDAQYQHVMQRAKHYRS